VQEYGKQLKLFVAIQFLYLAIMARILNKSDFGLMAIANSFVVFGNIFADGGMGATLTQRKSITTRHINAALHGGILLGVFLFILFFNLAPLIARFFGQGELEYLIKVISINFLILSARSVSFGILIKEFKFKEKSFVTIFSIITSYSIGIILAAKGSGVWSLVIATLLFSIFKTIGFFYFARIKFLTGLFFNEWKELFSFGFGFILLEFGNYFGTSGINLVLGKIFSPSALGIFERTMQIKTLPSSYLGNILDTIMFPALSEIQDEHEKLFKIYQFSLGVVNTLLIPVAAYLIFFSKEIVLILLGKNWSDAVIPLQIMFIVLPFSISGKMADSALRAKGLIYQNAFRKIIYVIILILCSAYGAFFFGLKGAAVGVTISYLFDYIIMLLLIKKVFLKSFSEIFLSPLLSGIKLTLILLIILIISTTLFNFWNIISIRYFLIISFFFGALIILIFLKKPSFFGEYISTILSRLNKIDK
jgi:O-antigen/teichoic acid export membrane protein